MPGVTEIGRECTGDAQEQEREIPSGCVLDSKNLFFLSSNFYLLSSKIDNYYGYLTIASTT